MYILTILIGVFLGSIVTYLITKPESDPDTVERQSSNYNPWTEDEDEEDL
jgi:hypothetical protein